ncbi:cytochrome P450 71B35-like [Hibiscus syriacus]|uniref:Cytochrome P450 71B35-like n=1 Tax=Hibiscus syriacus TaxID=106335 RepID=A0A6A3DAN6_HIBSY|nr:cytochrome P450 71B35-like [Hibiscus syriacus]
MDLFNSLVWLPFLLLLPLLLIFKKKTQHVNKELKNLPPSPPKVPIIGNLHQLGALPHSSLSQLASKYGPLMLLHLGRIPVLIVSSADAAKEVLKVNDLACCSRPKLTGVGRLSYNYIDVAFSPYNEYWRELRKLCVLEIFSVKRVKSFRFVREDEVGSLMDFISQSASSSPTDPVNLTEKVFAFSGSIIFRTAYGKSFRGSEFDRRKFYELIHDAETVAGAFCYDECFPGFGWIVDWISGHKGRVDRVFRKLDTLFQQLIEDHRKPERTKHEDDIIDVMLGIQKKQIEEHGHAWITKNHIKAILLGFWSSGDVRSGGVSSTTNGSVNAWAIGRDPKYWKNPEEFSPDRFIEDTMDSKVQRFELLSFGGGRRGCPGMYMGTVASEHLLANLLYCFDWALPAGTKEADVNMEEQTGQCLTLSKKTPLLLVPISQASH